MNNITQNIAIASAIGTVLHETEHASTRYEFDMPLPVLKGAENKIYAQFQFYDYELAFDTNWMWFMYAFEKLRKHHEPAKEVRIIYGSCECSIKVGTLVYSSLEHNLESLFYCLVSHYMNVQHE